MDSWFNIFGAGNSDLQLDYASMSNSTNNPSSGRDQGSGSDYDVIGNLSTGNKNQNNSADLMASMGATGYDNKSEDELFNDWKAGYADQYGDEYASYLNNYNTVQDMLWSEDVPDELIAQWYSDPRLLSYFLGGDYSDLAGNYNFEGLEGDELSAMRMDAARALLTEMRKRNTFDSLDNSFDAIHTADVIGSRDDAAKKAYDTNLGNVSKYFTTRDGLESFFDHYGRRRTAYNIADARNNGIELRDLTDDEFDSLGDRMAASYMTFAHDNGYSPNRRNALTDDDYLYAINKAYDTDDDGRDLYSYYNMYDINTYGNGGYYSDYNLNNYSEDNLKPKFTGLEYYSPYWKDSIPIDMGTVDSLQDRSEYSMRNGKKKIGRWQ